MTTIRLPLVHNPVTLIDAEDLERVTAAGPWHFVLCGGKVYAQRVVKRPDGIPVPERLHTFLTGWPLADHINGNGLDNRRSNLRPATPSQNVQSARRTRLSQSGFRGVYLHKPTGLWRACIHLNSKQRSLGYYRSPEEAARVRDAAARELFGEFAQLNFPEVSAP